MTKKDYELFANEIHAYLLAETIGLETHDPEMYVVERRIVGNLIGLTARVFARDNPAFNPEKYADACRTGKHIRSEIKNA